MWGVWLLVALMGTLEFGLLANDGDNDIAGVCIRMVILFVVVFLVSWVRKPWPRQKDLGNLEWQWYCNVMPTPEAVGYADSGARLITPEGRLCEVLAETPIQQLRVFRDPDDPVMYDTPIHVHFGCAVLSGKERLLANGASLAVAFVRIYVWRRRRWRLQFAQWTALDSRAATSQADDSLAPEGKTSPRLLQLDPSPDSQI